MTRTDAALLGRADNKRPKTLLAAVAVAFAVLGSTVASALTLCGAGAQAHVFNPFDTLVPATGTSSITVTCFSNTPPTVVPYSISLSSGPGSYAGRQMTGTGDTLVYNLYTTAAYTTVWGNGTAGTGIVTGSVTIPGGSFIASRIETVYGLIGAPQNVRPGAYSTAINITVTVTY